MARYDVCRHGAAGLVLDIQGDTLDGLNTRIVIPLIPPDDAPRPAKRLNPLFRINDANYRLVTQYMGSARSSALTPTGISLKSEADAIASAIDLLLQGF